MIVDYQRASPSSLERVIGWLGAASWRPLLGLSLLLALASPAIWLGARGASPTAGRQDGDEAGTSTGASPIRASLVGVVNGRFYGKPFMSRRAAMNEQLRPGEVLVVRFRLQGAEAAVHLEISGPKGRKSLWADGRPDSEPQPKMLKPGSHALVAQGEVVALRTEELGSPVEVVLIASPQPFPSEWVGAWRELGEDRQKLAARCPECVADRLRVLPPPEGVEPAPEFR